MTLRLPIRARVVLLALAALLGVGAAAYAEYRDIAAEVATLYGQIDTLAAARRTSGLVHALQRERGLSAGLLVAHDAPQRAPLAQRRRETDAVLARLREDDDRPGLMSRAWLAGLADELALARAAVDDDSGSWAEVRARYSARILEALDAVAVASLGGVAEERVRDLAALAALAQAREGLGRIRAALNRCYTRGRVTGADQVTIARHFGAAHGQLRVFVRDLGEGRRAELVPRVLSAEYRALYERIASVLAAGPGASLDVAPMTWWRQATAVIDAFKAVEGRVYTALGADLRRAVAERRAALERYLLGALALVVAVAALTVGTVLRIFSALARLLGTLDGVIRRQDYRLRIGDTAASDEFGRIARSVDRLLDFTDQVIRDMERLAATDPLTGLRNRRSLLEAAAHELDHAERYGEEVTVILIDVDHFKRINDRFGHGVGDETLQRLAEVLREGLREADLLARWGGEELLILAPHTDADGGVRLAEKLRAAIAATPFPGVGNLSASFGVAARGPGEGFDALTARADQALYRAKEGGRNRVCLAAPGPQDDVI